MSHSLADDILPSDEPITIFTTGGTIDKVYFDRLSDFQVGESAVANILSIGRVTQPFKIVELLRKDSLEISEVDRTIIVDAISRCPYRRILITHGTDAMTKTAAALDGIEGKSIVLVGSLSPARFSESDAAFNVGLAFGAVQALRSGVYIAMNGTIFHAHMVRKDREANCFKRIVIEK